MNKVVIFLIKIYQMLISPLVPQNTCRFFPTCSHYSLEAFQKFRFFKATWLTIKRIGRCHPFHDGGYDPLP